MVREVTRANPMSRIGRYADGRQTAGSWLPLFSKNAANHKTDVGWPLAQPAHEIRKPFASERDVHTDAVALADEHGLQVAADAVEHLELERIASDMGFVHPPARGVDHRGIVGGDRRRMAAG